MVNFVVFNELSLPFDSDVRIKDKFLNFFKLLELCSEKNLKKVRMDVDFKNYEILPDVSLSEFFGRFNTNITFQDKLREFLANGIVLVETPLIEDEEIDDNVEAIESEYTYKEQSTFGGLACSDIWNTLCVSFNSNEEWNTSFVALKKNGICLSIQHASEVVHLNEHSSLFINIESELQLKIDKETFYQKRKEYFPNKIILCAEIEKQVQKLDLRVFEKAVSILRDIEIGEKKLDDYTISGEGESVRTNPKLKSLREFNINGRKVFFEKHIKGFSSGNRLHYLEKGDKIYIGYIGKHLPNQSTK